MSHQTPMILTFTNPESALFFEWIRANPNIDLSLLINQAIDDLKDDSSFDVLDDVSCSIQEALAGRLYDLLGELCVKQTGCDPYDPAPLAPGCEHSLIGQLLARAAGMVDATSVAEAILRVKGKWSPDPTIPNFI